MQSIEIRKKFFNYFAARGHTIVPSSSLIPAQDPTLLFANAGMNQFKDLFLAKEKRSYTRAVSIQKCVRAGGKHNDLDNVGFTKRHLTFFEMMGNFSFGDYFKKEAIVFAWEFLTKELNIAPDNLYATVFTTDDESYDLWHTMIGLPPSRIYRLGEAENFWQMGDTGPCGPCTEIHIDRGPAYGCADIAICGPACNCDRFLELWNLVFMQFERQADGVDKSLKQTGVDTGMGLERLCAVLQNKDSVFQIDLFEGIKTRIEEISGKNYVHQSSALQGAFHVLMDHIRSSSLIIADGCAPSNDGRGYVLRKIIRRAALFAQKLSDNQKLFPELSRQFVHDMGSIYPELIEQQDIIYQVLDSEISKFSANLVRGQQVLDKYMKEDRHTKIIDGQQAFKLYDTYGFPSELLHVIAKEHGWTVDEKGFAEHMKVQQLQSSGKVVDPLAGIDLSDSISTEFTGYSELETPSKITAIIHQGAVVNTAPQDHTVWIITEKSPFFIVGGGQVPDAGHMIIDGIAVPLLEVRYINNAIGAQVKVPRTVHVGDSIISKVDATWRARAMKNHTATHLLQSALISIFGKQIKQAGSLVHPDYLRFDFTYHQNLSAHDIERIEDIVNQKIQEDIPVAIKYTNLPDALSQGALAFFGDKYNPEQVRMVQVPGFSTELCGGTHVPSTGHIGVFKIVEVSALSAGYRRIVAVTGPQAIKLFQESFGVVKALSQEFKVKKEEVLTATYKLKEQLLQSAQDLKTTRLQLMRAHVPQLIAHSHSVRGLPVLVHGVDPLYKDQLKELSHELINRQPGLYVLYVPDTQRTQVYIELAPIFGNMIVMKKLNGYLNTQLQFKGGGSGFVLQGTYPTTSVNVQKIIEDFIISSTT